MTDHASLLREAATAIRPMIEDDLDKREIYAAWRKKFSDAGLDWMAFKSLQKARVEDDRDESGDGKRVAKIMDRLDCTAAYAEMLGYGPAKMNENNCFSGSYSEAKGRGDAVGKTDAIPFDPETGELTDTQESGCSYSEASISAVSPASDESEQDDVGATASSTISTPQPTKGESDAKSAHDDSVFEEHLIDRRRQDAARAERQQPIGHENAPVESAADTISATNSNSPGIPLAEANSAGEAPSSQASPATVSDLPISTTPSFSGRVTGEMPDIPEFLRRTEGGYLKHDVVEA